MSAHTVVDADGHIMEPEDMWVRYMPESLRDRAPRLDRSNPSFITIDGVETPPRRLYPANPKAWERAVMNGKHYRHAIREQFSPSSQLEAMDVEGVDVSVLFPSKGLAVMGIDGVDPIVTTAAAHAYNTWLAEFASEAPDRLVGVAMIDPRDVTGAAREAQRAVTELGFVAAFVRPNPVNGFAWHDPSYEPLWSALEEIDVPLCFHEGGAVLLPQVATDRFDASPFWHCATHPMENQMAMMSIVMGGVAERHPGLRFAFLECGAGWLPYWMWRMDEHVELETGNFPTLSLAPSEYVERQCFVSIDSDEQPGIAALEALGAPRVVWGSDYPHPDGKFPNALKTLSALPGMTEDRLRRVVNEAPLELYGAHLREKLRVR